MFAVTGFENDPLQSDDYHNWPIAVEAAKVVAKKTVSRISAIWQSGVIVGIVTDDANGLTVRDFREAK